MSVSFEQTNNQKNQSILILWQFEQSEYVEFLDHRHKHSPFLQVDNLCGPLSFQDDNANYFMNTIFGNLFGQMMVSNICVWLS